MKPEKNNNKDAEKKRRFRLGMPDKVILGALGVLVAVVIIVNVLSRFGLALINGAVMMYIPLITLAVLVGWGGYALIRRIRKPVVKTVVASVAALLMLLAMVLVISYVSYIAYYTVPQKYATVRSPSGARKLVVMRGFDIDSGRSDQRKAARLEADPEGSQDLAPEDIIMLYKAYPEVLGLFYRSDADVEGEVCLAYADSTATSGEEVSAAATVSHGTLMVDWLDDEATARFYAENPGVAEGGECTVRFH